jgi:hypothetical protein
MDKEGEEPTIHTLVAERDPENENCITLINRGIHLYAFEKLLGCLYEQGIKTFEQTFVKSLMGFAENAKSNTYSEFWKLFETSQNLEGYFAPTFNKYGTFKANYTLKLDEDSQDRYTIFGIYFVNELTNQINLQYYRRWGSDIKAGEMITKTLIYNSDTITLKMVGKEEWVLGPWTELYLPLSRSEFNHLTTSDYDVLTILLTKAKKSSFTRERVFRSDDLLCNEETFSRVCNTLTFYLNGTFLRETFNSSNPEDNQYYRTFGLFSVKSNSVELEFMKMSRYDKRPELEIAELPIISDTQIQMDQYILTESNGIIKCEKLTKLKANHNEYELDFEWNKLTVEQKTILAVLVEQAVPTGIKRYFNYSVQNDWDVYSREIRLYSHGTCYLKVYNAGHDYHKESYTFGTYSVNANGDEFTLRICNVGALIPYVLKLTETNRTVTWNNSILNNATPNEPEY